MGYNFLFLSLIAIILLPTNYCRVTDRISLPASSPGSDRFLLVHRWGPKDKDRVYIQAALHADELPGMLVANKLIELLDAIDGKGAIKKEIVLIPYANPIGLNQNILDSTIGRFSISSGINFNRELPDFTISICDKVKGKLSKKDCVHNVKIIREALLDEINKYSPASEEAYLKKVLYELAAPSDIVLDLHSDSEALVHMYTHDRLWPAMSDLAAEIQSTCHLIAPFSGGNSFDEACSCPWAEIADRYSDYPISMACQAVTIELRGETDVQDSFASKDAFALLRFLKRRGYIDTNLSSSLTDYSDSDSVSSPDLLCEATPLTGVDMIEAPLAGILIYNLPLGTIVQKNDKIAEILDVVSGIRTPVISRTNGIFFARRLKRLVRPGQVVGKIAGNDPLPWRKSSANLLTSK